MKRIISLFMSISIFALTLCGCTNGVPMPKDTKSIKNNEILGHSGITESTKQGDSIYYSDFEESIYRYDISSKKTYLINKIDNLYNSIVYNDYIYSSALRAEKFDLIFTLPMFDTSKGLFKISLDGKRKKQILKKYTINQYTIQNDKIYFTADGYNDNIKEGSLFVCDLDGSNEKKIADNAVSNFYVNDKYAYFYDFSKFYRLDLQTLAIKDIDYFYDEETKIRDLTYTDNKAYVIYISYTYTMMDVNDLSFIIDEIDFDTGKVTTRTYKNLCVNSIKIYKDKIYGLYSDYDLGIDSDGGHPEKGGAHIYRFDLKTGKKEDFHRYYDISNGDFEYFDDGLYVVDINNCGSSETNEVKYIDKLS